jgi:hypothetical protein
MYRHSSFWVRYEGGYETGVLALGIVSEGGDEALGVLEAGKVVESHEVAH